MTVDRETEVARRPYEGPRRGDHPIYQELLAALNATTEPSRDLDYGVWIACLSAKSRPAEALIGRGDRFIPYSTFFTDVALAITEAMLPHMRLEESRDPDGGEVTARFHSEASANDAVTFEGGGTLCAPSRF